MRTNRASSARKKEDGTINGNLTDAILCWIENYIEENHLQVGDLLPTEDTIVRETGTSRTSAREAITRLRAFGVIESRRKRGMRLIRPLDLIDLARVLGSNAIPPELVSHVGGFRSALELGMESEIFRHATNQDIIELRQLYEGMVAHSQDPKEWSELDSDFHQRLIRITGNKVAIWMSNLFGPFFEHIQMHESAMSESTREKHLHIVQALERRDPVAFQEAMREHHCSKIGLENYNRFGFRRLMETHGS